MARDRAISTTSRRKRPAAPTFAAALLAIGLLIAAPARSQVPGRSETPDYVSHVLTTEHGLPQNTAQALARTTDGYLWIGTLQGLARFDGHAFDVFTAAGTDGLLGDRIMALHEDREGALWIGTQTGGLSRYAGEQFTSYRESGLDWAGIDRIYEDPRGRIWITGAGGVASWNGELFATYTLNARVDALAAEPSGTLWVGTRNGLYRIADGRLERAMAERISALAIHPDGTVWAGSSRGLLRHVPDGEWQRVYDQLGPVQALAATHDSTLWIGLSDGVGRLAGGGLDRYRIPDAIGKLDVAADGDLYALGSHLWRWTGSAFRQIPTVPVESGNVFTAFLVDAPNLVWIGTRGRGLTRIQERLIRSLTTSDRLPARVIHGVLKDRNGDLWAGTFGGGVVRIGADGVAAFDTQHGLAGRVVTSIAESVDGTLWAAADGELSRFAGGRFHAAEGAPIGVEMVAPSDFGGLWLGTEYGAVYRFSEGVARSVALPDHVRGHRVQTLLEVGGALWIGFGDGRACRYDGSVDCLRPEDGLPSYPIREIYPVGSNVAWFGTYGGGLCRGAIADPSVPIICLTRKHGLIDDTVHRVLEDTLGYVWLPSNRGLMRIRRVHIEAFFRGERSTIFPDVYTTFDGMPATECNGGVMPAGFRDRDGVLFVPTMNGIAVVDPARIASHSPPAPVSAIRDVRFDGRSALSTRGSRSASALLPAEARRVVLEYGGLHLPGAHRLQFRYRLDGHDGRWIEARDNRIATYTNLGPGDYTFRVQSRSGSTGWGEAAIVSFTKVPYLHEMVWFRALAVVGLLGLVLGGVGLRIRSLKRRQVALETLVDERTRRLADEKTKTEQQAQRLAEMSAAKSRFFANLSHEFRAPLTLLIAPLRDGLDGLHGRLPKRIRTRDNRLLEHSERLLNLVNQLLDLSKLEASRMELQASDGDLIPFLRSVVEARVPLAERNGIALHFVTDRSSLAAVFDRERLRQVFDNLISNAVEFTEPGGKIHVSLAADGEIDGMVEIVVKDTGTGIPAERLPYLFDRFTSTDRADGSHGTGIGLALAKDLVVLHGGSIRVESEPGFGSAFYVILPCVGASPSEADYPYSGDGQPKGSSDPAAPPTRESETAPYDAVTTATGSAPLVLIAEDNRDVRSLLRSYLEPTYRVIEAENGTDALEAARSTRPALIISDVMMPGMDGIELCAAIRSDDALAGTPIIMLTALGDEDDHVAGIRTGADSYVSKPFHRRVLLAQVEYFIASRQELRSRYSKQVVLGASTIEVNSDEERFLQDVLRSIESGLSDDRFTVADVADALHLSRRQLERKLRDLSGQSPAELVRQMRMERAAQLLEAGRGTVAEVAAQVGYRSPSHFSVAFKDAFGRSPSDHAGR